MTTSLRLRWIPAVLLALLCPCIVAAQDVQHVLDRFAGSHGKALILFFVASDCPVSNRYFPEMKRLSVEFAPKGLRTLYLYPNNGEDLMTVKAHQREFGAKPSDGTLDASGMLAHWVGARTTPEAAVVVRNGSRWKTVYAGRIDDRYMHIGLERPRAEHHDVEDAIQAILAGKPVKPAGGRAVGCSIASAATVSPANAMRMGPH